MDYNSIRALTDASSEISRVEVNQRALIDKILARYATASAVYRELLQNSNDASAKVRCGTLFCSLSHNIRWRKSNSQRNKT